MKNGLLASGSTDSTIRIWDMDNFMAVTIIKTHLDFVNLKLIQLQNGDLIYGGKFDSLIAFSENKDFELISDLAKNSPIEFNEIYDITELNDNEFAVLYNDAIEFWKENEDNGYECNNYIEFGEDFDPVCILKFNKEIEFECETNGICFFEKM